MTSTKPQPWFALPLLVVSIGCAGAELAEDPPSDCADGSCDDATQTPFCADAERSAKETPSSAGTVQWPLEHGGVPQYIGTYAVAKAPGWPAARVVNAYRPDERLQVAELEDVEDALFDDPAAAQCVYTSWLRDAVASPACQGTCQVLGVPVDSRFTAPNESRATASAIASRCAMTKMDFRSACQTAVKHGGESYANALLCHAASGLGSTQSVVPDIGYEIVGITGPLPATCRYLAGTQVVACNATARDLQDGCIVMQTFLRVGSRLATSSQP